ncbi:MAG: hypothetical protein HQK51_20605, partial [Oligoflexia bacterium]|nr:hypothetical protein [Oligoflexia bacterium]
MNIGKKDIIPLSYLSLIRLLESLTLVLLQKGINPPYQIKLHSRGLSIYQDQTSQNIFEIKFPLTFPEVGNEEALSNYIKRIPKRYPSYIIFLVKAGKAALAAFDHGQMIKHRVIRKYMVRAKQGKSQLSYLKTKGKSRAGSRLRLANAKSFFEEINEKISEWKKELEREESGPEAFKFFFYSCSKTLWPYLFNSKVQVPFGKKDQRLRKIPMHIQEANYRQLIRVNKLCNRASMTFHNRHLLPAVFDFYQVPDFFKKEERRKMEIYLVGGAVRDMLMEKTPVDRDYVVVGGSAHEMKELGYQEVGKDFPVFLHPETKEAYALAARNRKSLVNSKITFENSTYPLSTMSVSIEEDLASRDLTINAMAITNKGKGVLIDPFNGRADLDSRILRHVSS